MYVQVTIHRQSTRALHILCTYKVDCLPTSCILTTSILYVHKIRSKFNQHLHATPLATIYI